MLMHFVILLLVYIYYSILIKEYGNNHPKGRRNLLTFAAFLLILQSGLRNLIVGADTFAYYEYFYNVMSMSWDDLIYIFRHAYGSEYYKDPGYSILVKLFSTFIPDFRCFLIFVISLFIHPLFRLIYRFNVSMKGILISISLYLALFYSFFSITGIRQTIATAIALYVVPYALNRRPIKFIIPIIIAATIHKSVLLFIPFYFFPIIKNSRVTLLLAFAAFLPMWLMGQTIGKTLIAGTIFDTYETYLNGNVETNGALGFAVFIILSGILCLQYIKKGTDVSKWNPLIHAVAFSIFYTPMTSIGPSQMRVIQYYSIMLIILMPQLVRMMSKTSYSRQNYEMYAFLFFSFYACFRSSTYAFFWEPMRLGDNYIGVSNSIIQGW